MISPGLRALVRVSAAVAARTPSLLEEAFAEALGRVSPRAMDEVLLQSYLFVGYPVALDALARWRAFSGQPPPGEPTAEEWQLWGRRGPEVCRSVYGSQYDALRRNVRRLHPDLERWMITEGYGKVLGRPGLELAERELCIVALLAVLRTPRQLYSHLRGALTLGIEREAVEEVLEVASGFLGPEGRGELTRTWASVLERRERNAGVGRPDG